MTIDTGDFEGWGPAMRAFALAARQLASRGYPMGSRYRAPGSKKLSLSQHGSRTAADFPIQPEQVPAFVRDAWRAGVIPLNEMTREQALAHGSLDWTGPHMHVQLLKPGRTPLTAFTRQPFRPIQITEVP